jgi:hypothetical protein
LAVNQSATGTRNWTLQGHPFVAEKPVPRYAPSCHSVPRPCVTPHLRRCAGDTPVRGSGSDHYGYTDLFATIASDNEAEIARFIASPSVKHSPERTAKMAPEAIRKK